MANMKEFTIKINGVEESHTDITNLRQALKELDKSVNTVSPSMNRSSNTISKNTQVLQNNRKALEEIANAQNSVTQQQQQAQQSQTQQNQTAAGSIDEVKKKLEELIDKYEALSEAERNDIAVGGKMLNQIQELRKKHKELQETIESTGTAIGNSIGKILTDSNDFASIMESGAKAILFFDDSSEGAKKAMEDMAKVMATINTLQSLNNVILKEGGLVSMGFTAIEKVRAVVTGITTKAITASTVATKLFTLAIKSTGIGFLVVGLGTLIANFDKVKAAIVDLFPSLGSLGEKFDKFKAIISGVFNTLKGFKNGLGIIQNYEEGYNKQTIKNAEAAAREKAKISSEHLNDLIKDKESLSEADWKYTEEGIEIYRSYLDAKIRMYETDTEEYKEAIRQKNIYEKEFHKYREKQENETNEKNRKESEEQEKKAKEAQDKRIKAYEDRKKAVESYYKALAGFRDETYRMDLEHSQKLIDTAKKTAEKTTATTKEELDKRNKAITEAYDLQILMNLRLANDKKKIENEYNELITKAREAGQDTVQIEEERSERLSALYRAQTQDEIKINEEKDQKIKASKDAFTAHEKGLLDKKKTEAKERIANETGELEKQAKKIKELSDDAISRKGRHNFIDTDETKKNLAQVKEELNNYLKSLNTTKTKIESEYDSLLATYTKDSKEYKKTQEEKEKALADNESKIKQTNKQLKENTQQTAKIFSDSWKEVAAKMQSYADHIMTGVNESFKAMNAILQDQLDEAKEKLSTITAEYDKVVEKRKESDDKVKAIEEEAKTAKGGRLLVLQSQIQQEMDTNKKLAKQEEELAKEKERLEKEAKKKETQQKRIKMVQDIVQATSNVALGVTKAWGFGPILGPIMAAIVGAAGAIQIGIMSKQLAKLEDGGLLRGKRHAQGGMRIEGTNIEVEGGEYVVNRESTDKNIGLIRYINSQRREVSPADVSAFFTRSSQGFEPPFSRAFEAGGQLPAIDNPGSVDNESLVEAIRAIRIEPRVSVTDIDRVRNEMVSVDGWVGL